MGFKKCDILIININIKSNLNHNETHSKQSFHSVFPSLFRINIFWADPSKNLNTFVAPNQIMFISDSFHVMRNSFFYFLRELLVDLMTHCKKEPVLSPRDSASVLNHF